MNDPILPDEGASSGTGTNVQPGAQPQPGEGGTPAAPAEDRFARLEKSQSELAEAVRQATQAVQRMLVPQAAVPEEPVDKFLERLATDPRGTIREVARGEFQQGVTGEVGPTMRTMLEATNRQLMATHRTEVDLKFGAGTFDELFRPQLEKDVTQLLAVNPAAAANPETVQALVDRLYGGSNFAVLRERERAMEAARSRGVTPNVLVPSGGVPRLRQLTGDELPDDVEQHLRNWERQTGEAIDRKQYAKLYYSGTDSGPGRHRTTVAEYLQAIGADADTKRLYLGEKTA
ncbi:MAG: hypothetical protein L0170_16545 [Acidobacteria bacterium]|nr:hypothetical protein [Acidobacteriota bacterium]